MTLGNKMAVSAGRAAKLAALHVATNEVFYSDTSGSLFFEY
jgi:hypothetical protein